MEILVKVSGDLQGEESFYKWLDSVNNSSNNLSILCGGGTAISDVLKQNNISFKFGPSGREIYSTRGRALALQVLKKQKAEVEKRLSKKGVIANVLIPIFRAAKKAHHLNGDHLAVALHPNFDKIFIVTKEGRTKSFPKKYPKIEVVYL